MCGIAGIFHRDGQPVSDEILERMAARLHHRGPDGRGTKNFGSVGFAHTRLRIIDLSDDARQPLSNEDGTVWVTFNGEIYDFTAHRHRLEAAGHVFRSRSDTEVIVHLYEERGLDGLSELNGMFAYALWDGPRRRLVLARDRTGQKPFYVYEKGAHLAFASEPKALFVDPEVDDALDEAAVADYLAHGYVPSPRTFHRHVEKLDPGTFRVFEGAKDSRRVYWSYPTTDPHPPPFVEAQAEVRRRVERAVERRIVADVPLGAFLSGGVDSSVVVAAMVALSRGEPVRTFSLGFSGDPRFDETQHARAVSRALGTRHTELYVEPRSFELLPRIIESWDEPFGDSSAIPTSIVSQLAREHTTVVLTGDGGDELFGGYARFASVAYAERLPAPARRLAAGLAGCLPGSGDGLRAQAVRFARRLGPPLPERLHRWVAVFPPEDVRRLCRVEVLPNPRGVYACAMENEVHDDPLNLTLRLNARTYLLDDLNVKLDRASMSHALEARCPFLDVDLMRYVFALPASYKIHLGRRKWILRRAFADALPAWVFARRKMGFGLPLGAWFRGPLRDLVEDCLGAPSALLYEWVNPGPVRQILEAHGAGRRDHGHQIWALLMLECWLRGRSPRAGRGAGSAAAG